MRGLSTALAFCGLALSLPLATGASPSASVAVKVEVRREGMYRLSYEALAKAGMPPAGLAAARLGLTCAGKPVARRVLPAGDGTLGPGSAVLFFGQALDTRWTDTNVYWLTWDGTSVLDMAPLAAGPPHAPELASYPCRQHLEQNREYGYLMWAPEKGELDPWFWQTIKADTGAEVKFALPGLAPGTGSVRVRAMLRGRTAALGPDPDHHVKVELNATPLGAVAFSGQAQQLFAAEAPASSLRAADNALQFRIATDSDASVLDQVFLDWVELEYPRVLHCEPTGLAITLPGGAAAHLTVRAVPAPAADLYDVSTPDKPTAAPGVGAVDGSVSCTVGPTTREILVCPPASYLSPERLTQVKRSSWRAYARSADYLIICPEAFREAIRPLAEYRSRQGLATVVVPLGQIYDEFADGVVTPYAIRDFVSHAYAQWRRPRARYVLLVGDANFDGRDYLGTHVPNYLPAYPVRVRDGVETAADSWYVCGPDYSQHARLAVGRFPASTPQQVATLVRKTLAYERQDPAEDWGRRVLCVADTELEVDEPSPFEVGTEQLWRYLASFGFRPEAHYLSRTGISRNNPAEQNRSRVRATATQGIIAAWNAGVALVTYEGHGGATYWSRQHVLESGDVAQLSGPVLPICVEVTCFSGQFDRPDLPNGQCLAETLLTSPAGGAAACVSPTRLGGLPIHSRLAQWLCERQERSLGVLVARARESFPDGTRGFWGERETYNLLGDPALRVAVGELRPTPAETVVPQGELLPPEQPLLATDDAGGNHIDDRLDSAVAKAGGTAAADKPVRVMVYLGTQASGDLGAVVASLGGTVLERAYWPPRALIEIPLRSVMPLAGRLGKALRLMRLATP